jgi:alpha-L-rhamnosidase
MMSIIWVTVLALLSTASVAEIRPVASVPFGGALPIWSSNATAQFVLLRRPFRLPSSSSVLKQAVLHISAQPVPNRLAGPRHGGSLASKLLCAYKLWVNGVPVGAGPGRPTGDNSTREHPALLYDSFEIGGLLRLGTENVVAVEAFYWTAAQESVQVGCPPGESAFCKDGSSTDLDPSNPRDKGGVLAWLSAAALAPTPLLRTGDDGWRVYTQGDSALTVNHGVTNGQYHQPHEFYDMRFYPNGWRSTAYSGTGDSEWVLPRTTLPFARMASKGIAGIRLDTVAAAAFHILPSTVATGGCYVVDFGGIIQGGLNATFANGTDGGQVTIFAGETLHTDGTVKWWEDNLNDTDYRDVWTLRDGRQTITSHEYKEARYWQVCNAPEPPTHALIGGWRVWFPLGAIESSQYTAHAAVPAVPVEWDPLVFTSVSTSSPNLNSVWELCRYTLRVAALDVNTDSNTRQRDPCNWDSHLQAIGQAAIAPAASAPYRRRSVSILFEPDARVMVWTEFFLFTLFAAFEYTFESADLFVATAHFDELAAEYSCGQFVTKVGAGDASSTESLVVKDPGQEGVAPNGTSSCKYGHTSIACMYKDLIDWPAHNDSLLPADSPDKSCCRDGYVMNAANAPINAHVWAAHQKLAWLATAIGRPSAEASQYTATAAALKRGIVGHLARPLSACDPPVGPCFADGANESHTSVQATMYVIGHAVLTPEEAQPYFPFLRAKSQPFPRCSAALSHFLLEALYIIAEGQEPAEAGGNEAADLAFELMTRDGHRSWREMLAQNATMTIEHWFGVNLEKHTWAHPWSAGPAAMIVRRLFGVRPLEMGYSAVAIHPQPPRNLSHGATTVPTRRGTVAVSFAQSTAGFQLNISVPTNMTADVCLPAALVPQNPTLLLDGTAAASTRPHPGQLCLADLLGSGSHRVEAV